MIAFVPFPGIEIIVQWLEIDELNSQRSAEFSFVMGFYICRHWPMPPLRVRRQ